MVDAVAAALDALPQGPVAVAVSGGRDSVALLDAVVATALASDRNVVALHVHHGLSKHADAWAAHVTSLCAHYRIACLVRRVSVRRAARTSVEAAAREARYAALADAAREAGVASILLAHHRDDQAETLLLQLLRGAGPAGLAAMPAHRRDARGILWSRPLLDVPRAAIEAHVARRALRYVDDDSNADTRHARNAVRRIVAPALAAIAPDYAATIARASAHQADAALLADDLAAIDAARAIEGRALDRVALAALPDHRARNLLRWYLRAHGLPAPSHAHLTAMLHQLRNARPDAQVRLPHAGVELGIHRNRVVVHGGVVPSYEMRWNGEEALALPHGRLDFRPVRHGGLDLERLGAAPVVVRPPRGGERFALDSARPRRALTSWLREAAMPHWERRSLPLVFCGDALAAVAALGIDTAFRAAPGRVGVALVWNPTAISTG